MKLRMRVHTWMHQKLRRQVIVYATVAMFGSSLLLGVLSLVNSVLLVQRYEAYNRAQHLERLTTRIDDKLDLFIRHTKDLSKNTMIANALLDSKGRTTYLAPFLARYRFPLVEPHGIALCDFDGQLLVEQKLYPVGCFAERPERHRLLANDQPQLAIIETDQEAHLVIFQPVIYALTGHAEGYLVADIGFASLIRSEALSDQQTVILRTADSLFALAMRGNRVVPLPELPNDLPSRSMCQPEPGLLADLHLTVALYEPSNWWVGISGLFRNYAFGTLLLLFLTVIFARRMANQFVEPILLLKNLVQWVTLEGPASGAITIRRQDEIGDLAYSFSTMLSALKDAQEHLEDQVASRTKELELALVNLGHQKELVSTVLDSVCANIAVLDKDGLIIAVNHPWQSFAKENGIIPGMSAPHTGVGVNYLDVCHTASEEGQAIAVGIIAVLVGQQADFSCEYACHAPDKERWFTMQVTPLQIVAGGAVVIHQDITERKQLQDALQEEAVRDLLTGLFNRRYLETTLIRETHRCQRDNLPLTVAMLDLDRFKNFNDTYGHAAGDTVLQAVGGVLRQSLRASDIACRYGGEELTIIFPGSTADNVWAKLDAVRLAIQQLRLRHDGEELPTITVSIGAANHLPADGTEAESLIKRADAALYQAKEQGRNRVVIADATYLTGRDHEYESALRKGTRMDAQKIAAASDSLRGCCNVRN